MYLTTKLLFLSTNYEYKGLREVINKYINAVNISLIIFHFAKDYSTLHYILLLNNISTLNKQSKCIFPQIDALHEIPSNITKTTKLPMVSFYRQRLLANEPRKRWRESYLVRNMNCLKSERCSKWQKRYATSEIIFKIIKQT